MANENSIPELKDHAFTLGAGEVIAGGKSHYPSLVRLVIPKDRALEFALNILNGLHHIRPEAESLVEIPMFGTLEELKDE